MPIALLTAPLPLLFLLVLGNIFRHSWKLNPVWVTASSDSDDDCVKYFVIVTVDYPSRSVRVVLPFSFVFRFGRPFD